MRVATLTVTSFSAIGALALPRMPSPSKIAADLQALRFLRNKKQVYVHGSLRIGATSRNHIAICTSGARDRRLFGTEHHAVTVIDYLADWTIKVPPLNRAH